MFLHLIIPVLSHKGDFYVQDKTFDEKNSLSIMACVLGLTGFTTTPVQATTFELQQVTDMLHLVLSSDRAVYTKKVVKRLTNKEKVIKASEFFEDDKALPLPAQMFRFSAEAVADKTKDFSYSLLSL